MIAFEVNDMTCGHCAGTIDKAVKSVDRQAEVDIDLARHLVQIRSSHAGEQVLGDAIRAAGYTPKPAGVAAAMPTAARRTGGCCCG